MATADIDTRETPGTLDTMLPIIIASILGTAIGWYDVFLYGFFSVTVFPVVFFPRLDPVAGIIASFTTNLVGFGARPIGAAIFGWFGDRIGRRSTLVATLLLLGTSTILMGILPGYASIGIAAPVMLAVLRFLQGVGVGGEWGGAVLLPLEYGDDRRRGFWASWPQTGVPVALALSTLMVQIFQYLYPGAAFDSIGWRMPFFMGAMLVLIGLYIRLRILETPAFTRIKEQGKVSKTPLVDAFRYGWREIILSALLRSGEQAPFYILTTFLLSYGIGILKVNSSLLYASLTLAALIAFFTMPIFSAISDRVGRKRWSLLGCVLMAAYALPYFLLLNSGNAVIIIVAIALSLGVFHAWLYGLQAAQIAEMFATPYRYTGASIGYQLASITAGGPAPLIATYILANHSGSVAFLLIAAYIAFMAFVSFIAILPLKEYAGKPAAGEGPSLE
ncbi:MAG: MFS transporter [Ktedonobacteraceae bacterium]